MGKVYSLPWGLKGVASPVATQIRNVEKRKVPLVKVPKTHCGGRKSAMFKVKVKHINKLD